MGQLEPNQALIRPTSLINNIKGAVNYVVELECIICFSKTLYVQWIILFDRQSSDFITRLDNHRMDVEDGRGCT